MFSYPVYKAIKAELAAIAPCFFYCGQYTRGKDNTSYKVPAIYIETPKASTLQFWGRRLLSLKPAQIHIHYISYTPFKNMDNTVQENALAAHEAALAQINTLLNGKVFRNAPVAPATVGTLLTQALIPTQVNSLNVQDNCTYSIITYTTEIYTRHLCS